MAELIERVCSAHRQHDPVGPLVTIVEGVWGYCAGNAAEGHIWKVIEPTRVEYIDGEEPPQREPLEAPPRPALEDRAHQHR
jgi:hypothetical protein